MTSTTTSASTSVSRDETGRLFGQTTASSYSSRSSAGASSAARVMTSGFHGCDQSPSQRESVHVHLTSTYAVRMTHFTLEHSLGLISSAAAAWLMVRAGAAKHQLLIRPRARCAACGRRLTTGACPCTRHAP
jgi:hypothetical protein